MVPEISEQVIVTRNGIDPSFVVEGKNKASRMIYASDPMRGLWVVLRHWKTIKEQVFWLHCYALLPSVVGGVDQPGDPVFCA